MVVQAVLREPVSAAEIPCSTGIYREFAIFGAIRLQFRGLKPLISGILHTNFPTHGTGNFPPQSREMFLADLGIEMSAFLKSKQGLTRSRLGGMGRHKMGG